uniref:Chlorophyllase n=1 Tax=Noctiluca scintillans TaxID=2966 RepID=A0A7S1F0D3_NOCSC|mmetsp:Transcript_24104/g.63328  ORF Transcript_24104/g.63328 Transcript_24104/m.63328 type:complete len:324 (+) Transcript_24104:81-1052(+)
MALSWLFALLFVTSDGFNVQHASVRVEVGGDYELHLYAPERAGLFPVIFFVSGVSGDVPVTMYSDLLTRIVAEGYIVAGFDHLAFPSYPAQGQQFHDLLEWSKTGLVVAMRNQSLAATPDVLDRAAVMGQSAGNHIVGQGLFDGCSVAKALIMIDPVDGTDPFHIITSEDLITVGSKLPFTIPSLLLDNTLDPVGKFLEPPCAPWALGSMRFYNAMAGPIFNVNATGYGHVDCVNDGFSELVSSLLCPTDTSRPNDLYRAQLATSVTTFLGALFNSNQNALTLFEDAANFNIEVTVKQDLKGLALEDIVPGCTHATYEAPVVI